MKFTRNAAAFLAAIFFIGGCGGGQGGGAADSNDSWVDSSPSPLPIQANVQPVADAGTDLFVPEQTAVQLDGSASSDADGDQLTFSWIQVSGLDVSINNADSAQASFRGPELFAVADVQTLEFELTVSDGHGGFDTDKVIVNVEVGTPDANQFLTFLNSSAPQFEENEATAEAYYRAVDPSNAKTTLNDWLVANQFDQGFDARAVYRNAADLGFGRLMTQRRNADGSVAAYVENYPTLAAAVDAANTGSRENLLATVAMEYSAHPDDPTGHKYTKFYTFVGTILAADIGVADGTRVTKINLDGRGDKFQPGVCNVCHGGQPKPLVNGEYPDFGDTGAQFLPWDVDTFEFSEDPLYTRAEQEDDFKKLNQGALATYPVSATPGQWSGVSAKELIHGWYGGVQMPLSEFNGEFVPQGWRVPANGGPADNPQDSEEIYLKVVGPNCRACHVQRGRFFPSNVAPQAEGEMVDFASYRKFINYRDEIVDLVFGLGQMPDARLTFDNFWSDHQGTVAAELLAGHLEIDVSAKPLGRPIANPGPNVNTPIRSPNPAFVDLNGFASRFAESFTWTFDDFAGKPGNSEAAILGDATPNPTLAIDVPGSYRIRLVVSNLLGESEPKVVVVTAFNGFNKRSFAADIEPILEADCAGCHSVGRLGSRAGIPVLFDDPGTRYESAISYVNIEDIAQSLLLTKPTGVRHAGDVRRGNPAIPGDGFDLDGGFAGDKGGYDKFLEWIAQGAKDN